jgi:IS30 family transposase
MGTQYSHLTMTERQQIAALAAQAHSARSIGRQLNLHHSTISRELSRGTTGATSTGYDPLAAQRVRAQRRGAAGLARRKLGPDTDSPRWRTVRGLLAANWSPQQIAGRLRRMSDALPDSSVHRALCVSHETIYCAIYALPRGTLRTELVALLRKSHKSRMPRARGDKRSNALNDMTPIALRPPEVAARTVPGHWEGDLIKGAMNRSAVGTLVERTSRYVMLVDLPGSDAQSVLDGFTRRLKSVPQSLRETLTYDQGREMALHKTLARNLKIDVFFCDAHSPWQRGTNENANGLIREYLPKGMDLSTVSRQQLTAIEQALNHRPRKILDFQTPHEVFSQLKLDDVRGVALQA